MKDRLWRYSNQIQARYDTPVLTIVVYLKRGRPGVHLESWESCLGPDFPVPRSSKLFAPEKRTRRCEPWQ